MAQAEEKINHLNINCDESLSKNQCKTEVSNEDKECLEKWGFQVKDLFRLALKFYKEKEGKAVHLSYQDKLRLVAYSQQVSHGPFNADTLPPLGVLDVIGRDRRLAWQALGNLPQVEAMLSFIKLLHELCPHLSSYVEANKRDAAEKQRLMKEEEARRALEAEQLALAQEALRQQQEEQLRQEAQRRQIQDALNQQTFAQFKAYAEQQYPGNPDQQAILVRQLQEQHYHQYMQQLLQNPATAATAVVSPAIPADMPRDAEPNNVPEEAQLLTNGGTPRTVEDGAEESEDDGSQGDFPPISPASMWTRKDIREFKDTIRKEGGDSIIKVGHGETVTVRVPTHEDGTCLFWEFATDSYDIGFGVFFEWSKPESSQVSVHISESEEDEEEEEDEEDEEALGEDLEQGSGLALGGNTRGVANHPPISIVVPVYRRDCQEEVYAGSHSYPGSGVYLLKFDNSYSLWRSKTLYYRVYYTR
ncbi:hypothetical protein B566_EDAN014405 [Ephemera danica]|nr:hypothetical protein B566_EDAN014405 [Ephemera danica]